MSAVQNVFVQNKMPRTLKIAVEGCAHGELDDIYASIAVLEKKEGIKIDLLLCAGDFQAVRNEADLLSLACPPKYRAMNTYNIFFTV
jgi:lariat debranching enzyme